jgi:hypothetical protein
MRIIKQNICSKKCFNEMTHSIFSNKGGIFFIDAPSGTGNRALINLLWA